MKKLLSVINAKFVVKKKKTSYDALTLVCKCIFYS